MEGLASDQPAPASGSAAAAVVAAAAALLEKSAKLSTKQWAGAAGALDQAYALRLRSEELIEDDVEAYLGFVDAKRAAKSLDGEAHEQAVRAARELTIDVPILILGAASQVVELAEQLTQRGNRNLIADEAIAALLASAAAEACVTLIACNVEDPSDDMRLAEARMLALGARVRALSLRPEVSSDASAGSPR
jgi:formiminotetrahydrofolate cyclodeaminase